MKEIRLGVADGLLLKVYTTIVKDLNIKLERIRQQEREKRDYEIWADKSTVMMGIDYLGLVDELSKYGRNISIGLYKKMGCHITAGEKIFDILLEAGRELSSERLKELWLRVSKPNKKKELIIYKIWKKD